MERAARQSPLRFGVVTDIHYALEQPGGWAATEIQQCIDSLFAKGCQFIAQLGDLIAGTPEQAHKELASVLPILEGSPIPVRHVIGNHCLEVPVGLLAQAYGLTSTWYGFDEGGWRFLVLDGMEVSSHEEPMTDTDRKALEHLGSAHGNQEWCGAIGSRQKAWLGEELRRARDEASPVIVLCHLPLHPATTDERHGILWNQREIRTLLAASGCVAACIGGHYHHGGYAYEEGIHFIVLPAFTASKDTPETRCTHLELEAQRMRVFGAGGTLILEIEHKTSQS